MQLCVMCLMFYADVVVWTETAVIAESKQLVLQSIMRPANSEARKVFIKKNHPPNSNHPPQTSHKLTNARQEQRCRMSLQLREHVSESKQLVLQSRLRPANSEPRHFSCVNMFRTTSYCKVTYSYAAATHRRESNTSQRLLVAGY